MNLTDPIYFDADKAREHLESLHWPHGPVCPHCGTFDGITKLQGKSTRPGVYKCNACRKPFTVTVGTVMEDSKIALNKWLLAFALYASSKKGFSAHQLHRQLGITYKSAWFMAHRIRLSMEQDLGPMGGPGVDVEADETFFGRDKTQPKSRLPIRHMNKIVSLIDRSTGRATSVVFAGKLNAADMGSYIFSKVDRSSRLLTDEARYYLTIGREFAAHDFTTHGAGEYVKKSDRTAHTNTVEGFFGIFKRGMKGIYQHCGQQHLQRYVTEFDFRYTYRAANGYNDTERAAEAVKGARGKRLTYRQPSSLAA